MERNERGERVKVIQSPQNPIVKRGVRLLQKKKEREKEHSFMVEGLREVNRAFQCGYRLKTLYYRPDLMDDSLLRAALPALFLSKSHSSFSYIHCSPSVFQKLAYRSEVPNVIGEFELKTHPLALLSNLFKAPPASSLSDSNSSNPHVLSSVKTHPPLILGLDQIEKPGNLGAILRTASGLGVDGVLLCDPRVDLYHPNVIRNSLGGLFHLPIAQGTLLQTLEWYKEIHQDHNLQCYTTNLEGSVPPHCLDLKQASLIMLGSEAFGVRTPWVEIADQGVFIPMDNEVVDSFNVSVASALMVYEALRQRQLEP